MSRIRVPIKAYILGLFPQSGPSSGQGARVQARGQRMQALSNGLAVPSFWTRAEITRAFDNANLIWIREANIEFSPVNISERLESVHADEHRMWVHFVNNLPPRTRGIGVGFVFDLPSHEGGWGGGRVALISGRKVRSGLPGFAGSLLAHELGQRYRLIKRIGSGGMGEVYAAFDDRLDRTVALKLVRSDRVSASARQRIVREARAGYRKNKPSFP